MDCTRSCQCWRCWAVMRCRSLSIRWWTCWTNTFRWMFDSSNYSRCPWQKPTTIFVEFVPKIPIHLLFSPNDDRRLFQSFASVKSFDTLNTTIGQWSVDGMSHARLPLSGSCAWASPVSHAERHNCYITSSPMILLVATQQKTTWTSRQSLHWSFPTNGTRSSRSCATSMGSASISNESMWTREDSFRWTSWVKSIRMIIGE